jgi:hypothetical protein
MINKIKLVPFNHETIFSLFVLSHSRPIPVCQLVIMPSLQQLADNQTTPQETALMIQLQLNQPSQHIYPVVKSLIIQIRI